MRHEKSFITHKRNFIILLISILSSTGSLYAVNYPNNGDFPKPMGASFYKTQADGYNIDGTLASNPIEPTGSITVGGVTYTQETLKQKLKSQMSFDGNTYQIYINIPQNMIIANAYRNWQAQFPSDYQSKYDIIKPTDNMINGGNATPSPAAAAASIVPHSTEKMRLAKNTKSSDRDYIPNYPDASATDHSGLTANIFWNRDHYLSSTLNGKPEFHMAAYGWALSSEKVSSSVFIPATSANGGTPLPGGPVLVSQASQPFNYFKHLMDVSYGYSNLKALIPVDYFLNKVVPSPAVEPEWLEKGAYMTTLAYPGFQRNLIRWYTPWGTWNMIANTTDLFVRKNEGGVEFPVDATDKLIPVVRQTWNGTHGARFSAIDETSDNIPLVVTNYIGSESYFASNVFLPAAATSNVLQAGLIPYFSDFKVYDGTFTLNPRTVDGFLGERGEDVSEASIFYEGKYVNEEDPGGQANKPYLMGPMNDDSTTSYNLRFQHANSFMVARHDQSESSKVYSATYYFSSNGVSFKKIAKFDWKWEPWSISAKGKWQKAVSDLSSGTEAAGTFVPQFTLFDSSFNNVITVAKATAFNTSARSLTYGNLKTGYDSDDQNYLGGPVTYETLTPSSTNPAARFLMVFGDSSPAPPAKGIKVPVPSTTAMQLSHYPAPGAVCNPASYWIPHLTKIPVVIPYSGGTFTAEWAMTSASKPTCSVESTYENPTLVAGASGSIEAQYGSNTNYAFIPPSGWTCSVDGNALLSCDKS